MSSNIMETLVGAIVLVVAAGFLVFAYDRSGSATGDGYELIARFERVDGLGVGSDVRLSGIKVGSIIDQQIDSQTYQALVRFSVNRDIELPVDTAVIITSEGLLGGNYLAVQPGGALDMLAPGDEIEETQDAVDLIGLINKFLYGNSSDE